jgi:homoisocitrate dehydrogenase
MLRQLGYFKGADRIDTAVDQVIREGTHLTPDLGGTSSTTQVVNEFLSKI